MYIHISIYSYTYVKKCRKENLHIFESSSAEREKERVCALESVVCTDDIFNHTIQSSRS